MKKLIFPGVAVLFLAGCASPNVPLNPNFWKKPQHVKVANDRMQHAELYKAGEQRLLGLAVNDMVTHSFQKYLKGYNLRAIKATRSAFIKRLRAHHVKASAYRTVDRHNFPDFGKNKKQFAVQNYTSLAAKIGTNKLLLISALRVGAIRRYYSVIPLDAPRAFCVLEGRLVNVKTNAILWRYTSSVRLVVNGRWDQPPRYPNFTRALNKAISIAKLNLLDNFFSSMQQG